MEAADIVDPGNSASPVPVLTTIPRRPFSGGKGVRLDFVDIRLDWSRQEKERLKLPRVLNINKVKPDPCL